MHVRGPDELMQAVLPPALEVLTAASPKPKRTRQSFARPWIASWATQRMRQIPGKDWPR
jgi:hypothetical protein